MTTPISIPEVKIFSVPQYLDALAGYPNLAWIYRGQADVDWILLPKAGRPEYFLFEIGERETEGLPPRDICRFNYWRELAVAYHKKLPNNDFECLAFAQHYGLATRLMDWSSNPLVALFFAVESCSPCDGAVYAHAPSRIIDSRVAKLGFLQQVAKYEPPPFDSRILLQAGVFTYHPEPNVPLSPKPVEDLGGLTPDHGTNLVKFVLKGEMKPIIKRRLDEIGLSRKALFPDLDGLSAYINWGTSCYAGRRSNKGGR